MSRKPKPTCYMCPRAATSREHVPPAAFFPESKDSPLGIDYRRNLITVPSCAEHNAAKSGDDQFVATIIASCIQTNEVAQRLMTPKTIRAIRHRPGIIGFFDRLSPVHLGPIETGAFLVDRERFDRAADHQARGLFYNYFGEKLASPLTVHTSSLFLASGADAAAFNAQLRAVTDLISQSLDSAVRHGENPDVFFYQIARSSNNKAIIRMVYYGGFIVDAFVPDIAEISPGDA